MTSIFKLLVIFLFFNAITGCTNPSAMNIAKAKWLCKDHGGLYDFNGFLDRPVECRSGYKYSKDELAAVIMPVEFAKENLK